MLKLLIKKQLLELFQGFTRNRKTGQYDSGFKAKLKVGAILAALLFSFAAMFMSQAETLAPLLKIGKAWLFFLQLTMMAVIIGVMICCFSAYSSLYVAKDNDLLMSMPIKPIYILISRLAGIMSTILIYVGATLIPGAIYYIKECGFSFGFLAGYLVYSFDILMTVMLLSCIIGWIIGKISPYFKNRSYLTTIFYLIFLGAYYYFYFNVNAKMAQLVSLGENAGNGYGKLLQMIGEAATGKPLPLLIITAVVIISNVLLFVIMARSYIRLATSTSSQVKNTYHEKKVREKSAFMTLLSRECGHLIGSPNYLMNSALASILMLAGAVGLLIYGNKINQLLFQIGIEPQLMGFMAMMMVVAICGPNSITSPSISLEGKTIWLIHSLPVNSWTVLMSKLANHMLFTVLPAAVLAGAAHVVLHLSFVHYLVTILMVTIYCAITGSFGLVFNLIWTNLDWSNETVPIKQSLPVFLSMIVNVAMSMLLMYIGYKAFNGMNEQILTGIILLVMVLILQGLLVWLKKQGTAKLEKL